MINNFGGNGNGSGFAKLLNELMSSGVRESKHAEGRQKTKPRKKYKDKSRARYVARIRMKRQEEAERRQRRAG